MKCSSADYVVLLNSDTVVPRGWVDKILRCAESDSRTGIVSPLSNAASYQSVPKRRAPNGDWLVNELPEGLTVEDMALIVSRCSERQYPRVPFANGFCYAIKRQVIDAIGYFDEVAFPQGFGEENDYSIRAQDAGFEIVIADDAYVFHSKSGSFGHKLRRKLSGSGYKALIEKHGTIRIEHGIDLLEREPHLRDIRTRIRACLESQTYWDMLSSRDPQ